MWSTILSSSGVTTCLADPQTLGNALNCPPDVALGTFKRVLVESAPKERQIMISPVYATIEGKKQVPFRYSTNSYKAKHIALLLHGRGMNPAGLAAFENAILREANQAQLGVAIISPFGAPCEKNGHSIDSPRQWYEHKSIEGSIEGSIMTQALDYGSKVPILGKAVDMFDQKAKMENDYELVTWTNTIKQLLLWACGTLHCAMTNYTIIGIEQGAVLAQELMLTLEIPPKLVMLIHTPNSHAVRQKSIYKSKKKNDTIFLRKASRFHLISSVDDEFHKAAAAIAKKLKDFKLKGVIEYRRDCSRGCVAAAAVESAAEHAVLALKRESKFPTTPPRPPASATQVDEHYRKDERRVPTRRKSTRKEKVRRSSNGEKVGRASNDSTGPSVPSNSKDFLDIPKLAVDDSVFFGGKLEMGDNRQGLTTFIGKNKNDGYLGIQRPTEYKWDAGLEDLPCGFLSEE